LTYAQQRLAKTQLEPQRTDVPMSLYRCTGKLWKARQWFAQSRASQNSLTGQQRSSFVYLSIKN